MTIGRVVCKSEDDRVTKARTVNISVAAPYQEEEACPQGLSAAKNITSVRRRLMPHGTARWDFITTCTPSCLILQIKLLVNVRLIAGWTCVSVSASVWVLKFISASTVFHNTFSFLYGPFSICPSVVTVTSFASKNPSGSLCMKRGKKCVDDRSQWGKMEGHAGEGA